MHIRLQQKKHWNVINYLKMVCLVLSCVAILNYAFHQSVFLILCFVVPCSCIFVIFYNVLTIPDNVAWLRTRVPLPLTLRYSWRHCRVPTPESRYLALPSTCTVFIGNWRNHQKWVVTHIRELMFLKDVKLENVYIESRV